MNSVTGPDPADLTDDELFEACHLIGRLALEVIGVREHVTRGELAEHDAVAAFVYKMLGAMHAVLVGENERRTAAEVKAGLEAIQRHLGGP